MWNQFRQNESATDNWGIRSFIPHGECYSPQKLLQNGKSCCSLSVQFSNIKFPNRHFTDLTEFFVRWPISQLTMDASWMDIIVNSIESESSVIGRPWQSFEYWILIDLFDIYDSLILSYVICLFATSHASIMYVGISWKIIVTDLSDG